MSKPITVSSCAFVHQDDVDAVKHITAKPINEAMEVAIAGRGEQHHEPGSTDAKTHVQSACASADDRHHCSL
jgi:hypothetical protein